MNLEEIKKHWEYWAAEFETDLRATTKTTTIKGLEINALYRAISSTPFICESNVEVLEVGCGNGYNCFALEELLDAFNFTGVDFIDTMIKNAKRIKGKNEQKYSKVNFFVGDILDLNSHPDLMDEYHIVFTDRCIINLNTLDLQLLAFDQLRRKVRTGGYLIILENVRQTHQKQNALRKSVGLTARPPAEFNLFLDEDEFLAHASKTMELVGIDDFGSLHDVILYVLTPLINNGEIDYENPLVRAAAELSISISERYKNPFGSFGQNRLYLFKK